MGVRWTLGDNARPFAVDLGQLALVTISLNTNAYLYSSNFYFVYEYIQIACDLKV